MRRVSSRSRRAAPGAKLKALGIQLRPAPTAVANYVPAVRTGNLVFLAGQGPLAALRAEIGSLDRVRRIVSSRDG